MVDFPSLSQEGMHFSQMKGPNPNGFGPQLDEKPRQEGLVTGHDFSRADKINQIIRALAPVRALFVSNHLCQQPEARIQTDSGLAFSAESVNCSEKKLQVKVFRA